jgi:ABC-type nitrate/sulfonate/bicarbonate transport system substrate-binding protein
VASASDSSSTAAFRIGGVPEHFNLPWHLAIAAGSAGIPPVDWRDYASGTGAMLADLAAGRLDLAVLLTEGAALGLARGLPIVGVSLYTQSPLIWGVHTAPRSRFGELSALDGARFAISRPGSGSHLMSLALALARGWPVAAQRFVVVGDLGGAIEAFRDDRVDVFLWERFTTEPAVEAGSLRRIGDFVAPWPAWTLCARRAVWEKRRAAVLQLFAEVTSAAARLRRDPACASLIAARYGLRESAVVAWLERTEWVDGPVAPGQALKAAHGMLEAAGAIAAG